MEHAFYDCNKLPWDMQGRARVNWNMNATFPYIHYTNPYYKTARTLWGSKEGVGQ